MTGYSRNGVGRIGGEEPFVIYENTSEEEIYKVVLRWRIEAQKTDFPIGVDVIARHFIDNDRKLFWVVFDKDTDFQFLFIKLVLMAQLKKEEYFHARIFYTKKQMHDELKYNVDYMEFVDGFSEP